ncbi:TetR family transcriptional regulator [Methylobacterium sp. XJLW]|uniref:Transcriptional regulator n=1 Tax=Methylobacterium oryzae CBMB20 TaxID=693986 RepID=A0A089NTU4_9HYPH|nr:MULTISPECIES: TetR/AcrR family transcriptional regulator [Methylobacterium]AIQ89935.1 Transcriptional regulator [Methylobacterium oryzae CBMB20]AWV17852.1 TetR family transcriptional regulator [Methylobacterium sp. XJLW]
MTAAADGLAEARVGPSARREHILDAAEACFTRNGFHRTTMQDLAREAAMSPGNFYRYFESKEALVLGLVERERERGTLLVAEMEGSSDPRGTLLGLIARYFMSITREAAALRVEIWSESTRNPAIAAMTVQTEAESRDWFVATLSALATTPACDPAALYALLAPLMKGIVVSRAALPDYDVAGAVTQIHQLLHAGLDGRLPCPADARSPAGL